MLNFVDKLSVQNLRLSLKVAFAFQTQSIIYDLRLFEGGFEILEGFLGKNGRIREIVGVFEVFTG